jgi:hypothetical protein
MSHQPVVIVCREASAFFRAFPPPLVGLCMLSTGRGWWKKPDFFALCKHRDISSQGKQYRTDINLLLMPSLVFYLFSSERRERRKNRAPLLCGKFTVIYSITIVWLKYAYAVKAVMGCRSSAGSCELIHENTCEFLYLQVKYQCAQVLP